MITINEATAKAAQATTRIAEIREWLRHKPVGDGQSVQMLLELHAMILQEYEAGLIIAHARLLH